MSQLPRGQSLKQVLPPALYQRTVSAAKQLGLAEASLQPMQPWVAAITLTQQALQKAGYQAELGVDHYYASAAARMGVPVRGLERVPEQFAYLASMGDLEDDFLQSTIDQIGTMQEIVPQLLQAWHQRAIGRATGQFVKEVRSTLQPPSQGGARGGAYPMPPPDQVLKILELIPGGLAHHGLVARVRRQQVRLRALDVRCERRRSYRWWRHSRGVRASDCANL